MERIEYDNGVVIDGSIGPRFRFGFTERTGGVSCEPYASLNLGTHVGDDPVLVRENRRRVLCALGCESDFDRLLVPNQVHGDDVVLIDSPDSAELDRVRDAIGVGADAIVCTVSHVPVMLCYADCVPVVLELPGRGFAVVHSGWKGTFARISAKAALVLCRACEADPSELRAYLGPHILGDEYEVSEELLARFAAEFERLEHRPGNRLDLSSAIVQALEDAGVHRGSIVDTRLSTIRQNDRFFSYRKEHGRCGRHGAVAVLL